MEIKIKGVYSITNQINNKKYIGESLNINRRWVEHKEALNNNKHKNYKMQNAWNKYGAENFEFKVELILNDNIKQYIGKFICIIFENQLITQYNSINKGYNIENTLEEVLLGEKIVQGEKDSITLASLRQEFLKGKIYVNNNIITYEKDKKIDKKHNSKDIQEGYSKINNKLFYVIESKDTETMSIFKYCNNDYNTLFILDYLYTNTNRKGETVFTIEDIITMYGFKCDTHKGKSFDKFKYILERLQELDIIQYNKSMSDIKPKEFIRCIFNGFEKDKEENDIRFIQLYDIEKYTILDYKKEKIDNKKLLFYYCYLKSRMMRRSDGHKDINAFGGKPEVCYPSYETISDEILLNAPTIKQYNDILVQLNLIRIGNAGLWYYIHDKNKLLRESTNIYTLYCEDELTWKGYLKTAIKYFKEQNPERIFIDSREYKHNDKQINGFIGRIQYLESQGKATQEQIQLKNELVESVNTTDKELRIDELFRQNDNMLLSDIYDYLGNVNKYKSTLNIEKSLNLIDENENLLIDYEYYKWVMINYTQKKHTYYVNCVNKHKGQDVGWVD